MRKTLFFILTILLLLAATTVQAQTDYDDGYNEMDASGNVTRRGGKSADSLGTDKEIPKGLYVWTIDRKFGERKAAEPDTLSHMFMNYVFTEGKHGEYNTTGNLGSPRENRIFIDREEEADHFIFTNPYSYFIEPLENFQFTNTLSPLTNLTYNSCGDRTNGEDHFTARFAVNAGKRLGAGFKFDYIYGRGYYSDQSTSHFNYTMYASYIGDRYQAHFLAYTNHEKVAENGGITDDNYITHPESFDESFTEEEIPTMLSSNWNRNDNQRIFFSHRYSLGFNRKVRMTDQEIAARKFAIEAKKDEEKRKNLEDAEREARREGRDFDADNYKPEQSFAGRPDGARTAQGPAPADSTHAAGRISVDSKAAADSLMTADSLVMAEGKEKVDTTWMKNEYVPVTSFIHTLEFNNFSRIYQAYVTPENYYLDNYEVDERFSGDSIYDKTTHWQLRNIFAISLLEGFNKWAKAGLKVYAAHELRHFTLPDTDGRATWNENSLSVGGVLSKRQGRALHYNVGAEFAVVGDDNGDYYVDGGLDLNLPLMKDTLTFAASGFYLHMAPSFFYYHYQSRHYWWDNDDLDMITHMHAQADLSYPKTRTHLRVAYDAIKNHTYFSTTYTTTDEGRFYNAVSVKQKGGTVSVLTAELSQDITLGPWNWETVLTVQKSSDDDALPLPTLNAYTNLYLRFKIARVLKCDFGADVRYFTSYQAPAYVPGLGMYAVQGNDEKVETGSYPIVNVYANFHLQQTRFFIMMSHVNAGSGNKKYFLSPNYPLNGRTLRFGLSWNFFN